jgi:hypothetical protein
MSANIPEQLCGIEFNSNKLTLIRKIINHAQPSIREEIARQVCDQLNWVNSLGRRKLMSSKVALLRLHRLGLITLPPPGHRNGNGKDYNIVAFSLNEASLNLPVNQLTGLQIELVSEQPQSALWNFIIASYHYLGYKPLVGAQQRYLIYWDGGLLGGLGFASAAWQLKARDRWIGWDQRGRKDNLHLIANNSRFLILPWIKSYNLASKVLSLCAARIRDDYDNRYGYRPVLLETFVECGRFHGTSYKAANWHLIGQTKGRGKLDRDNQYRLPIKDIYVYPLCRDFRSLLGGKL